MRLQGSQKRVNLRIFGRKARLEKVCHVNDHNSANRLGLRFFPRVSYRSSAVNSD